jgi:hypothetical protein
MPEKEQPPNPPAGGVFVVKTTVNLPITVVEAMRELAKSRNITLGKLISDAIFLEQYLHERTRGGGRVLVEEPDKTLTHLWLR